MSKRGAEERGMSEEVKAHARAFELGFRVLGFSLSAANP